MFTHVTSAPTTSRRRAGSMTPRSARLASRPGQGPDPKGRYWWRTRLGAFAIGAPIDGEPACHANAAPSASSAKDAEAVQAFS